MFTRFFCRPRVIAALLLSTTVAFGLSACPSPELMPLVGEDPEIESILGTSDRTRLATSPLAAARRLHQALGQEDFDSAWELLGAATRQALDARGAVINASGRELLDASALPTSAGTMRRIRFSSLFFGLDVGDLELVRVEGEDAWVRAVGRDGDARELRFKLDDGLWRLHFTDF